MIKMTGCILLCCALAGSAAATTIDLAAEASRPAPNDLARATVFAEASSPTAGESAKRVNAAIARALAAAKGYAQIKVQSGNSQTYPVYAKGGGRIEAWRMRSEIQLESGDVVALSELLGKLQEGLAVSGIGLSPSPDSRRQAEDAALRDAIAAFRARAGLVADALGKPYRIKHLSLGTHGGRPPVPILRAAPMAAMEAAPMPVEAGDTRVAVTVSGQIELAD